MRAHIITNGVVTNTIVVAALEPGQVDAAIGGSIGDSWNGTTFTKPPAPPLSPAEVQNVVVAATQQRLDTFAHTRNYDGILSACTYANSTVVQFAKEGTYAVTARDNTWSTLYTILAEVKAGTRPMPTGYADVEPLLPALAWPV